MTQLHQIKLSKKRFLTFITTVLFLILHLVCKTGETIEGLGSLAKYKGCTEIDGNLLITIRGSGVSGKPYIYCSFTHEYSIINAFSRPFYNCGLIISVLAFE